jgi:hypothetical protein
VDYNGDALDGAGTTDVEIVGNSDSNIDAGEWTGINQIVVRDANGDITIGDLQATDTDAASGSAGTTFFVQDYAQTTEGVLSFEFDAQAVDGTDTLVILVVDEVAGGIGFSGGDIETLNLQIVDGSDAEISTIRALAVEGLQTLNVTGGTVGETFTIQSPLNTSIVTLDATNAVADLRLDVSPIPSLDFLATLDADLDFLGATQINGSTVLLDFTDATLEYNSLDRTIVLDVDGFDPVNLEVPAALADDWTQLPTVLDINTSSVSITGDLTGLDVSVDNGVGGDFALVSALLATPDDVPDAATYLLGSGDDRLAMGDSYSTGDVIDGGAGDDTLSMTIESSAIRTGTIANVETLDIFFRDGSTFDMTNVTGLTTINLGLDRNGDPARSLASADFDNIKAETNTLNIFATSFDLEIDYENGANADLVVNFENTEVSRIGDSQGSNDLEFFNLATLTINSNTDKDMFVDQNVDLGGDAEDITITTTTEGGDIIIKGQDAGFRGTDTLEEVTVHAVNGDISIGSVTTIDEFIDIAPELQNFTVIADDAFVDLGRFGQTVEASELETVSLTAIDNGAILQNDIYAFGANVASFRVTATDNNIIGNLNIALGGLFADQVDYAVIDAGDGGNILLDEQNYTAGQFIYQGTGTIEFIAGNNGAVTAVAATNAAPFVQTEAFDATDHTGTRIFRDNVTGETIMGSNKADTIEFARGVNITITADDVYLDAGGDDDVSNDAGNAFDTLTLYDDGSADLTDTGMATNDEYTLIGYSAGSAQVVFHAGGGNDTLEFGNSTDLILVDFDDYDSGLVELQQVHTGVQLSFDGLQAANGFITSNTALDVNTAAASISNVNDNTIYVLSDGDAPTVGPIAGATITDYENLTDVADYLDALTNGSGSGGDDVVFVINNGTTSGAPGDDHDAYIYVYSDNGTAGIQADDLTLIATADGAVANSGVPFAASDII